MEYYFSGERKMETKERNDGIDLLRIIAMFFVMILHTLEQGGLLGSFGGDMVNARVVWALEIIAFVAVNIFAMISGYVNYSDTPKPFRVSKYFMLWIMVFTYSIVLLIVEAVMLDDAVRGIDVANSLFPVTSYHYWYFTAYTGLFVLMPMLNALVRKYSPAKLKRILVVLFIVFSAYDFWANRFIPGIGRTFTWLIIMYFVGACIKKCKIGENIKTKNLILTIIACYFITWIWKLNTPTIHIFNLDITGDTFLDCSAPAVLICSVAYVILFSRIKIKKGDFQKFVRFCAPAVFAAYIITSHPFVWFHLLPGGFSFLCQRSVLEMLGTVLAFSALMLGTAVLIERGRMALFDLMRVRKGMERIDDKLKAFVYKPRKND